MAQPDALEAEGGGAPRRENRTIDPDEVTDTAMDMWERSWQDRIQTGITEAVSCWLDRRTVDVIHAVAPAHRG